MISARSWCAEIRDAMMLRDLEIEALYEGPAQRGSGLQAQMGAPFHWAPQPSREASQDILPGRWSGGSPRRHRDQNPVDQEAQQSQTNEYRRRSMTIGG
ncbi:MAG: hypothetical protein RQ885_09805 [Desulfurococcales archaeon]|nr:hypothetical protein [Desulfurococcales archaeon]